MTDNYNNTLSSNCTINDNIVGLIIPTLLFTIPCGLSFLCLMSLMVYTLIKPLFDTKQMEKLFYPTHPVRCIITGPTCCGKSVFLTNLFLNIINEYDKMYIYSPSLDQDLNQKLSKCLNIYIPIHIIPNLLIEEDIDLVTDEILIIKTLKNQRKK